LFHFHQLEQYCCLGKLVENPGDFRTPYGNRLFPHATLEGKNSSQQEDVIYLITQEDVHEEAQSYLGRDLTAEELYVVTAKFWKALEWLDWSQYLHEVIRICQQAGWIGPGNEESNNLFDNQ
jgi:hypothetical protein